MLLVVLMWEDVVVLDVLELVPLPWVDVYRWLLLCQVRVSEDPG
ncbi:hypothetical protein [Saccharopolyspora oryzae]|uniref:Uncharacterized protein n=1 Tax=Saccharopolyspora oryzae TaxID=2997343 RepID=A0ABT4V6W9_9PSEU|nr:hypothetical protein [Saccharopolyspora oryzae]MDA3629712.1 hypothetical protein [Saccharopolyspora oryzae]